MDTPKDVLPDSSPAVSEDIKTQEQIPETPVVVPEEPAPKGSKTPETNLYAALEEERRLRKEAEERARIAEENNTTVPSEEVYSDEGKILKNKISTLETKLASIEEKNILEGLKSQYPALKDKSIEFDEFRKDYPRHKLENVAKIFLAENDLLVEIPARKGLEKTVGGPKAPTSTGMTSEDVAQLRKTNWKKYTELVTSGKIRPEDIK
jgi:hypothetical protein